MARISQAQADLLARAGAEPGGVIYPPEDGKVAKALAVRNLAISLPIVGGGDRLIITAAGFRALRKHTPAEPAGALAPARTEEGGQPVSKPDETAHALVGALNEPATVEPPSAVADGAQAPIEMARPKGKLAALVDLLKRPEGASVEDMMTATGWQAHSVRGAMSGGLKKQLGLRIESEKAGDRRIYRIPVWP